MGAGIEGYLHLGTRTDYPTERQWRKRSFESAVTELFGHRQVLDIGRELTRYREGRVKLVPFD